MGQVSPPPQKKRRRWPVVAFVVVLVSAVAWWNWPRGDLRFVGKWQVSPPHDKYFLGQITLSRDGFGEWPATTSTRRFPWSVNNDALVIGYKARPPLWWFLRDAVAWVGGRPRDYAGEMHFKLESIEVGRITATMHQGSKSRAQVVLTRIPE